MRYIFIVVCVRRSPSAIHGVTLAEGKGEDRGELKSSATSTYPMLAYDDYICRLEMCLLTEDPVLASDGFAYSKEGLERWIAHCTVKGRPLTSHASCCSPAAKYVKAGRGSCLSLFIAF